jgi:Tol biopolymer transport system component
MTHKRNKWEIAVIAFPDGTELNLYDCPASDCRFPAWSPDGSQIAYNTLNSSGIESGIWVVYLSSGGSAPIFQGSEDGRPVWSRNARVIYFNRTLSGQTSIFRVILATGEILQLSSSPKQAYGPDWIP